ncbi:MAG: hypothetical protein LBV04_10120 [Deferribacteraceae bacterium]|jgi:hypothetical protein|nr:hypothetical protein [Deferribacteraceae bacterium]
MKKLLLLLILGLISCGDGESSKKAQYGVYGSYNADSRCVTIEWNYDDVGYEDTRAGMLGISRSCSGECTNIARDIDKGVWPYEAFKNCYDEYGDWNFEGLGTFASDPVPSGAYQLEYTLWVSECPDDKWVGAQCHDVDVDRYVTPELYRK